MKKVFLFNFATRMLREVALGLTERDVKILYWEAYRFDDATLKQDKAHLPHTIFNHAHDALKDILPKEVDTASFEPLSREIIERMRPWEFNAIASMEKDDYNPSRDPFPKRRLRYYTLIKEQYGLINSLKPDTLIFSLVPNSARAHVIYGLAKVLGIKVLMLYPLTEPPRSTLLTDYTQAPVGLLEYLDAHRGEEVRLEELSADVRDDYEKQRNINIDSTPEYEKRTAQLPNPLRILPRNGAISRHLLNGSIFRAVHKYVKHWTSTQRMRGQDSDISVVRYKLMARALHREALKSMSIYTNLQKQPDLSKQYVYVALHYQPEASSNPLGDVFEEQLLMVDIISASLPDGWHLYVKEHPMQWIPSNYVGLRYRPQGYYDRLAKIPNVTLIPTNTSTFDLSRNAHVVATLTGAPGWEAICRGTPVLIFGYPYYMNCEGVFRITNVSSCHAALEKVASGYKPDQQKVLQWLVAFDRTSIRAAYYRDRVFIENPYLNKEETVQNLIHAFYNAL